MNTTQKIMFALAAFSLAGVPMTASAQDYDRDDELANAADDDVQKARQGEETDLDPIPTPPSPMVDSADGGVNEQSGIGSSVAYSEAGVLELGGAAGFSMNNSLTTATLSPSIGWFVADNFRVSGLTNFTFASINNGDANDQSLAVSALVEPSYHLPFTDTVFGFAGLGAGVSYIEDAGTGLALQPRLGMNFLVGRSGIFTPSVNVGYSTVEADALPGNRAILTVEPSVGVQAGYTVMW